MLPSEFNKYPYFMGPVIDALHSTDTPPDLRALLKTRLAVNICSQTALREILALDSESLADFYADSSAGHPSTIDTIDTFLSRFASPAASLRDPAPFVPETEPEPTLPIDTFEPFIADTVDADAPADESTSRIDAFLKAVPPKTPHRHAAPAPAHTPAPAPTPATASAQAPTPAQDPEEIVEESVAERQSTSLTEGFARILIKNGNFSKALEIITQLNLNNPEKSIYFADQIRFLKKLIANQEKN